MALGAQSSHNFLPGMSRWAAALRSYLVFSYEEVINEQGTTLKYSAAAIFDRSGNRVSKYEILRATDLRAFSLHALTPHMLAVTASSE